MFLYINNEIYPIFGMQNYGS